METLKKIQEIIKEYRSDTCTCYDCNGCCHACNSLDDIEELLENIKELQ